VSDVLVPALPAHGGHGSSWIELIWVSPVLLFVVYMSWRAWRDRQLSRTARQDRA
jgi:hypothetical protein